MPGLTNNLPTLSPKILHSPHPEMPPAAVGAPTCCSNPALPITGSFTGFFFFFVLLQTLACSCTRSLRGDRVAISAAGLNYCNPFTAFSSLCVKVKVARRSVAARGCLSLADTVYLCFCQLAEEVKTQTDTFFF